MPVTPYSADPSGEGAIIAQLRKARAERLGPKEEKAASTEPLFKSAYVDDEGVIYAVAATTNTDLDNDELQTKAMIRMAHDFTSSGKRTFKANHADEVQADLVASMTGRPVLKSGRVLGHGDAIPADDPMIGLSLEGQPSAWVVGIRPRDAAVLELAKSGGIAGLSWGAYASRSEAE